MLSWYKAFIYIYITVILMDSGSVCRFKRNASWRSVLTLCKQNSDSATDLPSCRQRDGWCLWVCRDMTLFYHFSSKRIDCTNLCWLVSGYQRGVAHPGRSREGLWGVDSQRNQTSGEAGASGWEVSSKSCYPWSMDRWCVHTHSHFPHLQAVTSFPQNVHTFI